jgi:6-pyruvoyltetrahydropterin/6-carboxytetrahydropterin synthase
MTVACEFRWEMGHRLPEHTGGCRNLHGHSYRMRVEAEGEVQANGMVIDFYDLKAIVDPIVESWDHAFLITENDALLLAFLKQHGMKHNAVPWSSTAENIVAHLLRTIASRIPTGAPIHSLRVRVQETSTNYAEDTLQIGNA